MAAKAENVPLICFTPEGFAAYAGVLYVHQMWGQACALDPNHPATLWVDCAADPALIQEALEVGLTHLVFHGDTELFVKLSEIAAHYNASIRQDRPTQFSASPQHCAS